MPITAIVEFSPTEGLDPRESYDRLTRELKCCRLSGSGMVRP